ncbi:AMP-binding protein [Streptomyces indonesiensis]
MLAELPPLSSADDLRAIEQVPLAERDLALTTYELLSRAAQRWHDEPCSLWIPDAAAFEDNVAVTYGELHARVRRIAHGLHRLGVGREDAVTLAAPNCSDLLAATLAAQAVGIAAPVNAALDVRHLTHIVRLTGSRVLVTAGPELDEALWKRLLDSAAPSGSRFSSRSRPTAARRARRPRWRRARGFAPYGSTTWWRAHRPLLPDSRAHRGAR